MCEYIIAEDFKMDKYILNKTNGLWYELIGDYYLPCLTVPAEREQSVGVWGRGTSGISRSIARPFITLCY